MADLRSDLVAALREESVNLGCAGVPELDRLANLCERIADRLHCPVCYGLGTEPDHPPYADPQLGDDHHGQYDPDRPGDVTRALLAGQ